MEGLEWTGEVVGIMHNNRITAKQLAERLGLNSKYLSAIINGHRTPPAAEEKIRKALAEIIAERKV